MENELLIKEPIEDVVMHYAKNTQEAGLDGVVCSPLEVQAVKAKCGKDFITVTPGIRFAAKDAGDQVRITTPAKAKELGSDYIVVGRPITQAENPVEAYRKCVEDFVD
jgi:orotidine-5'-phosphate decarboxylase